MNQNYKMSHNACTVNCGTRGTVLIWLHSFEICGQVYFHYTADFAGTTFTSHDFSTINLCYSAIRKFAMFIGGVFAIDKSCDSIADYLNDLWSDVVFQQEVV